MRDIIGTTVHPTTGRLHAVQALRLGSGTWTEALACNASTAVAREDVLDYRYAPGHNGHYGCLAPACRWHFQDPEGMKPETQDRR